MLNDMYKKVADDKKNEVKSSNISMSRESFISEHKNLIKILRSGDKKSQEAEAAKQETELSEEIREGAEEDDAEEEEEKGND